MPVTTEPTTTPKSTWRFVLSGITTMLLVGVLVIAAALTVVPRLLDGASLTVLSGSMEPVYSPGDMVVSIPQEHYRIGDVVTFQPVSGDPTLITHRIIAIQQGETGTSYVTRGDANGNDDEPIVAGQVMGKVIYHVPYVGFVAMRLGEHRNTVIVVAGIALIGYGTYSAISAALSRRKISRSTSMVTTGTVGGD